MRCGGFHHMDNGRKIPGRYRKGRTERGRAVRFAGGCGEDSGEGEGNIIYYSALILDSIQSSLAWKPLFTEDTSPLRVKYSLPQ